jgi:hypothetical protein
MQSFIRSGVELGTGMKIRLTYSCCISSQNQSPDLGQSVAVKRIRRCLSTIAYSMGLYKFCKVATVVQFLLSLIYLRKTFNAVPSVLHQWQASACILITFYLLHTCCSTRQATSVRFTEYGAFKVLMRNPRCIGLVCLTAIAIILKMFPTVQLVIP